MAVYSFPVTVSLSSDSSSLSSESLYWSHNNARDSMYAIIAILHLSKARGQFRLDKGQIQLVCLSASVRLVAFGDKCVYPRSSPSNRAIQKQLWSSRRGMSQPIIPPQHPDPPPYSELTETDDEVVRSPNGQSQGGTALQAVEAPLPFERSSALWYPDGTIVLIAGNQGFRVYSGILVQQSSVFAELLAPRSSSDSDTSVPDIFHAGCPVKYVVDPPFEMEIFLRAMLSNNYAVTDESNLFDLAAILRLSYRYRVQQLQKRAIDALRYTFPTSMDKYLDRPERDKALSGDIFYVANVSRETNTEFLLPSSLLASSLRSYSEILHGAQCSRPCPTPGALLKLDAVNQIVVLEGRASLGNLARAHTLSFLYLPDPTFGYISDHCKYTNCVTSKKTVAESFLLAAFLSPFLNLDTSMFCQLCKTKIVDPRIAKGKKEVWEKIPGIYGLGDWEKVRHVTQRPAGANAQNAQNAQNIQNAQNVQHPLRMLMLSDHHRSSRRRRSAAA